MVKKKFFVRTWLQSIRDVNRLIQTSFPNGRPEVGVRYQSNAQAIHRTWKPLNSNIDPLNDRGKLPFVQPIATKAPGKQDGDIKYFHKSNLLVGYRSESNFTECQQPHQSIKKEIVRQKLDVKA